jgi:signal transduction histidine kinase
VVAGLREGRIERTPPADAAPSPSLLERVALALTSTLDLAEVLGLLARVGLDATGAGGTAVLLLEGRTLHPAAVVRGIEGEDLQVRFHGIPPIELDPVRFDLLATGQVVALEDAREHDLIPTAWVDLFDLRGVALLPLIAEGEACGLMVVDWDEVRTFSPADVALLQAIAAYAGIAVGNARRYARMRQRAQVQAVLARSAAELAAPVGPDVIASRLADAYVELLDARFCAVALLDPAWQQITTMAMRGGADLEAPIAFSDVPADVVDHLIERLTFQRRPVELDEHEWFAGHLGGRAAGVRCYVAVPVVLGDYARGLVLLGFDSCSAIGDEEAAAAEVLAGIAAAAIERHELLDRLDTQVRRLGAVQHVSASLNSSAGLHEVLEVVCSAFESILGSSHCSVNVVDGLDPHLLRTLAHRGIAWFAGRPESVSAVPRDEVASLIERWRRRPAPVVYAEIGGTLVLDPSLVPEALRSAALFPLTQGDDVVGIVVCGFAHPGGPAPTSLDVGQALADLAASAIDRARLGDALHVRLNQVEALYRLSDVVAATADMNEAVVGLNGLFRSELRARVGTVSIADPTLREAIGGRVPDAEEAAAIRAWRTAADAGRPVATRPTVAGVLVPVVHRRKVHGALRVVLDGDDLTPPDEQLLAAIGVGCGEIISKAALHREAAERERVLAVASERERIARDLHDSVGQVITGMGMLLTDYVRDAPDREWEERLQRLADLAGRGSREVRASIYALLFLDTRRLGLVPSLRELARTFEATTGLAVTLEVGPADIAVSDQREDVLFRVAHEALMNVERHARATAVRLQLTRTGTFVQLRVEDDGVGLSSSPLPGPDDGHFGLRSVRERIDAAGGVLRLRANDPMGTVVEVEVPGEPAGDERPFG